MRSLLTEKGVNVLIEALKQYADPENWLEGGNEYVGDKPHGRQDVWQGPGENGYDVARAALERVEALMVALKEGK